MIFLRGLVWALIGLIYAPLFTGFHVLCLGAGLGHAAFIPAAALAAAVGAAFYGARQVALTGTVIGLAVAALVFAAAPGLVSLWEVALWAALTGVAFGVVVRFPDRCSLHIPGKALTGLLTGVACGTLLALVEPLHPANFHITGVVAFMVSVNGVLYVATVPWWVRVAVINRGQPCNLIEALVIAVLAAAAAGSLWVFAGPMIGVVHESYHAALDAMLGLIPSALAGGFLGGAVTGVLLEAFGFRWVHDV
jgi:hypothetical protein